tara:strand:+ start:1168 stop:1674 length:507 start_codon:yes stop_codon:yes gene_type:complete
MKTESVIVAIPHRSRPIVSHVLDNEDEIVDNILQHWVDDDYDQSNRDLGDAIDRAGRDYNSFGVWTKEEILKHVKNNNTQGHQGIELLIELKKVTYNHWHEEAREDFIDGFKEAYGSENKTEAINDWDDWSNNIQGGSNGLGFETELQGFDSGKEQGELCKQMKEEQA